MASGQVVSAANSSESESIQEEQIAKVTANIGSNGHKVTIDEKDEFLALIPIHLRKSTECKRQAQENQFLPC